jgi:hypothetical protein
VVASARVFLRTMFFLIPRNDIFRDRVVARAAPLLK